MVSKILPWLYQPHGSTIPMFPTVEVIAICYGQGVRYIIESEQRVIG
jgi:hypothetical protein